MADDKIDQDVEGQRLAAVLTKVRLVFDADSKEYKGIKKLLVDGMSVSNLEARADAIIAARQKHIDDEHKYKKERKKLLAAIQTQGQKHEDKMKRGKKKHQQKHKHRHHINYNGKEDDYMDDITLDARTAFTRN